MANLKIKFDKLPSQELIFNDDTTRILMFSGGYGSGKTFLLCMKMLKLSYQNRKHSGGIMAPSYPDIKRDIVPTFQDILSRNKIPYQFHATEKWFRFPWMGQNSKLYLFSAEKDLAGPNLAYAGINEMSMIPKERLYQTLYRVRIKNALNPQIIMAGTPEDKFCHLEEFVEQQEKSNEKNPNSFKIVYGNTRENFHIDKNYSSLLEGTLDSQSLKIFMEGQIVRLGGNYFYYSFNVSKNISENIERIPDHRVSVSMDFNVGRMTSTFWNVFGRFAHAFDELILLGNSDTPEMGRAIIERFGTEVTLHIDASAKSRKTSGRSDLQILIDMGFKDIRYKSVNPTFRDRQLLVNGKLERLEVMINPRCKTLIKDLKVVKQLKSDYSKDKSIPELTHSSDGMDYLIDYCFPMDLNRKTKTIQL